MSEAAVLNSPTMSADLHQRAAAAGVDLRVTVGWNPAAEEEAARQVDSSGRPYLSVRSVGHLTIVGPIVEPGRPVCTICAEFWRRAWLRQHNEHFPVEGPMPGTSHNGPVDALVDIAAGRLLDQFVPGDSNRSTDCWVVEPTGAMRCHRAHVDPACTRCRSHRAPESREVMTPNPMDPETLRTASLPSRQAFRAALVDRRLGPIGHVWRDGRAPFGLVGADVALTNGAVGEAGYGRHEDLDQGERIAFAEAIERLCSAAPFSDEDHVRATSADLGDRAIDVRTLGLHPDETYQREDNEFIPFDPTTETLWAPASTLDGRSLYVPEHVAYWGLEGRFADRAPKFVFESSNGCAIGGSLAEAVAYGLFEIIERDGFLLHWYRGASGRVIDFEHPPAWLLDARRIAASINARIILFDQTTDIGVPVVTVLVLRTDGKGPYAYMAAGSHLDFAAAARSAVFEALTNAVMRSRAPQPGLQESLEKAQRLLDDPTQVETLREHTLMYQHPSAESRLEHLVVDSSDPIPIESLESLDLNRSDAATLATQLGGLVTQATGHEVVYVNQTAPPSRQVGLHVAKVVAPGTIPMTFGYWMVRLHGLDRLDRVPLVGVGLEASSQNALLRPHPFP